MPVLPWPTRSAAPRSIQLPLYVLFTNPRQTRAALAHAQTLARGLDATITLLAIQQVPYPLSVSQPPISVDFLARRLRQLAPDDSTLHIQICLCRDARTAARDLLPPGALLLIGTGSWFHRRFHRLASQLTQAGCSVIQTGTFHE